jgi:hypothetical protein
MVPIYPYFLSLRVKCNAEGAILHVLEEQAGSVLESLGLRKVAGCWNG